MITSIQITNTEIFAYIAVLLFTLLSRKIVNKEANFKENSKFHV